MGETAPLERIYRPTCIGFGHREGRCDRVPNRALNSTGLFCSNCERARRIHITRQMEAMTALFSSEGSG